MASLHFVMTLRANNPIRALSPTLSGDVSATHSQRLWMNLNLLLVEKQDNYDLFPSICCSVC